jgi:hypothetical protein
MPKARSSTRICGPFRSGSVYGASACHRVAVLAKSPLTPVRTPDDNVQLPFIDLGSERDRSLGAELFGRVSGDHDNLCQRQPKIDQLTRTRLAAPSSGFSCRRRRPAARSDKHRASRRRLPCLGNG